jgi:hypothetical protein
MMTGVAMRLQQAAERIGATIVTPGRPEAQVDRIYAGDRISDLLDCANDRTLLITNLAGTQLLRVAELMDVPGICLTSGHTPGPDMVRVAEGNGTLLMVSAAGMFETCGRLYQYMSVNKPSVENRAGL